MIIQLAGRLGRDPETRFTSTGLKVTTLTLAVNVKKGGKEETAWWRVTVWGERHDKMISFLKKGSALIVVGEMHKPEIWTDKEGRPQPSLEMTADILRFSPFGNPSSQEAGATHNTASTNQAAHGHSTGGHATTENNNYGFQPAGDFNHAAQGASSNYSEEQVPF